MRQSCAGESKGTAGEIEGCGIRQVQSHPAGMQKDKKKWEAATRLCSFTEERTLYERVYDFLNL